MFDIYTICCIRVMWFYRTWFTYVFTINIVIVQDQFRLLLIVCRHWHLWICTAINCQVKFLKYNWFVPVCGVQVWEHSMIFSGALMTCSYMCSWCSYVIYYVVWGYCESANIMHDLNYHYLNAAFRRAGKIPLSISTLSALAYLSLYHNQLTGKMRNNSYAIALHILCTNFLDCCRHYPIVIRCLISIIAFGTCEQ